MTRNPYISVALCSYNGERFFEEQLQSIAGQTRLPDELVVCDDGSRDKTTEIISQFQSNAPFPVRLLINSDRLGVAGNFNQAIGLCRGEIIALADQDDCWKAEKLMLIEAALSNAPGAGLVFTDAEVVDAQLHSLGYRLWQSVRFTNGEQKKVSRGEAFKVLLRHKVVTGATMAFRSEFKSRILPIPDDWMHDAWIAVLIAAVADLRFIDQPLIYYRQHQANQIGGLKRSLSDELARFMREDSKLYFDGAKQYQSLRARLCQLPSSARLQKAISRLDTMVEHLHARGNMPQQSTRQRVSTAMRELLNANYHNYSCGWKSAVKDIIFGPY